MYTYISVIEKYQLQNGKYAVRVQVSDSATIFVYFSTDSTEEEIILETNKQCAVINSAGSKVNIISQQESLDFPCGIEINGETINNPTFEQLYQAGWRYQEPLEIPEGYYAINKIWSQSENNINMAKCTYDTLIGDENEQLWQENKSIELKTIENTYVDFLTNDWTPALRSLGLIPSDYTITVDNTDANTNIGLLLQMRTINKETYGFMAGEFDRFKSIILELGGIMAKVKQHEI